MFWRIRWHWRNKSFWRENWLHVLLPWLLLLCGIAQLIAWLWFSGSCVVIYAVYLIFRND